MKRRVLILAAVVAAEAAAALTWLYFVDRQLRRKPAPLYAGGPVPGRVHPAVWGGLS